MATGPKHYAEAQWLMKRAEQWTVNSQQYASVMAGAQAHATLALAAATVDAAKSDAHRDRAIDAWAEVTK